MNDLMVDYSSLSMFMDCPRKYYYRMVCQLDTEEQSILLLRGDILHRAVRRFYESGGSYDDAMNVITSSLDNAVSTFGEEGKEMIAECVISFDKYAQVYKNESITVLDNEIQFCVALDDVQLVGTIDRVIDTHLYGVMIMETKTSQKPDVWKRKLNPNLQVDIYIAGYYLTTGIMPSGAVFDIVPYKSKQSPQRFMTFRTNESINATLDDVSYICKLIRTCYETGKWPRYTTSCVKYGYECKYSTLCISRPDGISTDEAKTIGMGFITANWKPFEGFNNGE